MDIAIIAAMGENRAIGNHGKIPWHLPADFKRFKEITFGHPVVMGRKTFESIGKPLPGRMNIVITHDEAYKADGISVAHSLQQAFEIASKSMQSEGPGSIFVLGGAQIYALALPMANKIYLTQVHGTFDGDAFFPEFPAEKWKLASSEPHQKDEKNALDFDFLVYERAI
jgi:dihydrofolate reductase